MFRFHNLEYHQQTPCKFRIDLLPVTAGKLQHGPLLLHFGGGEHEGRQGWRRHELFAAQNVHDLGVGFPLGARHVLQRCIRTGNERQQDWRDNHEHATNALNRVAGKESVGAANMTGRRS